MDNLIGDLHQNESFSLPLTLLSLSYAEGLDLDLKELTILSMVVPFKIVV